jgi:hypothetical protein
MTMADAYRVDYLDGDYKGTLIGPDGFECYLGEPEDCSWGRDGSDAVQRLNQQHREIERLREALERLLAAPRDHMTACDRTMGATHPCTCGADEARQLLS